ncbi:partner of Y14 and mago isoform X2 [Zootermopsis nevadensis]|uniref:partner of Y14 and mago isoform X2 n=1 Tax=Zootermopsis nevadensis TaxID=136037 RepID=UPI000B8E9433|nr:partner of Y14 and mago isoform X2 [Zootermopsis nevadensis]
MCSLRASVSDGATFIAASQRPDGTWRKQRRVRDGYIPPEEVPLYESKGKQFAKHQPVYPVGLSPEIINASKAKREKADRMASKSSPIPGLVIVSTSEGKSSKKKKRKKIFTGEDELNTSLSKIQLSPEPKIQSSQSKPQQNSQCKAVVSQSDPQHSASTTTLPTDPAKRIKNLRKRLREIESIEQKVAAGEQKLEKEQLDKVSRKKEVLSEIEQLTHILGGE